MDIAFPSFTTADFLGPCAALVIMICVCAVMYRVIHSLTQDMKAATKDVKDTCMALCDAFKSEAKDWRAEAKACREQHEKMMEQFVLLRLQGTHPE